MISRRGPHDLTDTIVALATPPGRSALGTVRLSGPEARALARRLFRPWREWEDFPPPRQAVTGTAVEAAPEATPPVEATAPGSPASAPLDTGVLIFFPAKESPTGEDLVEVTLHGSPVVLELFVSAVLRAGARAAEPGEFSYRAFLAGKIDAVQAEAVDDLIQARSAHQALVAHRQQGGALSRRVEPARARLVDALARVEGSIEFSATEDEDFLARDELRAAIVGVEADLRPLLAEGNAGELLRRGARVVLAGPVNAGKSSLFNALLGRERAIVHSGPGTTRDTLEAEVEWDGLPVMLVDTAGAREEGAHTPLDPVEIEGQRRGEAAGREADLVLRLVDSSAAGGLGAGGGNAAGEPGDATRDSGGARRGRGNDPLSPAAPPAAPFPVEIAVVSKIDLLDSSRPAAGTRAGGSPASPAAGANAVSPAAGNAAGCEPGPGVSRTPVLVSARTGEGLDALRRVVMEHLAPGWDRGEPPLVARARQRRCLEECLAATGEALQLLHAGAGEELLAVPLGRALEALARLTGRGDLEEIYDRVFSTFCIGK